ncbi:hypothetical protein [Paenibacillus polymyxa]|uniref:hypothetical protein n=1 Tax=Paenibacillus polymyxa TaxID=1406 RepID=UPI0005CE035F|nr:hypothetical protein [Paenibacillus polymyxa]KJD37377.1 hypothetical protein QD46_25250 [Paenibacillus polymyxa]MEE4581550.1 hypothetical protein [Paenibacillus polymyxa]RPE03273.1 hypothetical protein EG487_14855 [Paenibacillus polymyxa]
MEYISKLEFRMQLKNEAENIKSFNWGEPIPVQQALDRVPEQEGVLVLLNANQEIIFVSTSKELKRRVGELLNKSNGRFNDTAFVQFTLEVEYLKRFADRHSLKHFLLALEIGENNFDNVLDDDDPRIIEKIKRLNEQLKKAHS